jgi:hypothetical protein
MTLPRRTFLQVAAGAATLPAVSRLASAQAGEAPKHHLGRLNRANRRGDILPRPASRRNRDATADSLWQQECRYEARRPLWLGEVVCSAWSRPFWIRRAGLALTGSQFPLSAGAWSALRPWRARLEKTVRHGKSDPRTAALR